jgi:flagellar protein FliS
MMTNARAAYMDAAVATADPVRLLVMLCDRLVLDVQRALAAQQGADHPAAHLQLVHAQDIVLELRSSLRTDAFEGGEQLGAIYDHLFQQLVNANVHQDVEATQHCLDLVSQIADTWREAALQLSNDTAPNPAQNTARTA